MPKPIAAALVVLFLAACGGKTVEIAASDGTSAPEPAQPALPGPSDPTDPAPPVSPPPSCGASFRDDVLRTLNDRGCSNSSCHGGTRPRNEPRIDPLDAAATWAGLHAFTLSTGQPYVAPGASVPAASGIHCHLRGECGTSMSFLAGSTLSPEELAKVDTWLACGAPLD